MGTVANAALYKSISVVGTVANATLYKAISVVGTVTVTTLYKSISVVGTVANATLYKAISLVVTVANATLYKAISVVGTVTVTTLYKSISVVGTVANATLYKAISVVGTVTHAYNNVCHFFNNIILVKLLYSFLLLGNGVQLLSPRWKSGQYNPVYLRNILREKSLAIYFEDSQFRRNMTFNFILSNIYVDKRSRKR